MRGKRDFEITRIIARCARWLFALAFNKRYFAPLSKEELIRRVRRYLI